MIDDANKDELIEQYVQGKLRGKLLDEFKNKLAADAAFRADVALEQAMVRNLKTAGRAEIRLKFEHFHQEMPRESYSYTPAKAEPSLLEKLKEIIAEKLTLLNAKPYWAMAAASVVLLIAATFIFFNTQTAPAEIYGAYYTPYPIETFRSAPTENTLATQAAAAYNAGDYQRSITLFKQILAQEANEQALFYLGNAYLSANRPQEAINTYKLYLQKYREFENEAKWYLGLSYIKVGKYSEAQKLFAALAANQNPDNDYQEEAKQILKKYNFKKTAD
ncbi:hypothetical protein AAE02nite_05760 [Adhaeribacter aerolatus]|uniref:Uncharacterized protein n=1 Tax=Adhaeribacter aerolatus TaxID=670289 RepID=A0A512AT69_9BACT|nr:tetratricopeptide repeat protein [Adhaeribacter aerolatus]GEO02912.1 hypothetical protein AAE02nite_05760 [Adhaeribacter aerolatus]